MGSRRHPESERVLVTYLGAVVKENAQAARLTAG
jgi:hypothetical protein